MSRRPRELCMQTAYQWMAMHTQVLQTCELNKCWVPTLWHSTYYAGPSSPAWKPWALALQGVLHPAGTR